MRRIQTILVLPLLVGGLCIVACDGTGSGSFQSFLSQLSDISADRSDTSVADVTIDADQESIDASSFFSDGASRARVRNESDYRADITLRFMRGNLVVYHAFIQVLPDMVTTVTSIKRVDSVDLTGEDILGRSLNGRTYYFGVDFDAFLPVEYIILPDGRVEIVTIQQPPVTRFPTLQLLEPADDIPLTIGSSIVIRWSDEGLHPTTMIQLYLQPVDSTSTADFIPVNQPIGAALDGMNDYRVIVLDDILPGTYRVIARTFNTDQSVTSIAPGLIQLMDDPTNIAPTLKIITPSNLKDYQLGDTITVEWEDGDPDDNATITFELESITSAGVDAGKFPLSSMISEDADGDLYDSGTFTITGVLPGLYDLVGTIDDGDLKGESRVERIVRILPAPQNDQPKLTFLKPASDQSHPVDSTFVVSWTDSDENDNARITLLLDPDFGAIRLDGNELVLVNSIDEDDPIDEITLWFPEEIEFRSYRLLGIIIDGQTESLSAAPGRIIVVNSNIEEDRNNPGGDGDSGNNEDSEENDITIIDISDPTRISRVTTLQFLIQLTPILRDKPGRVEISNESFGGNIQYTLLAEQWDISDRGELTLNLPDDLIPSDVVHRNFEVTLEWNIDPELTTSILDQLIYFP